MNKILITLGAIIAWTASLPAQNLLINGSFELAAVTSRITLFPSGSTAIPGWRVGAIGNIEIIGPGLWPASEGTNSIDLSGAASGSISQELRLTNEVEYTVSFDMAYNGGLNVPASLIVTLGERSESFVRVVGSLPFWQRRSFTFTPTNTGLATLTFRDTSTNANPAFNGAAIDNVSVAVTALLATIRCSEVEVCWNARPGKMYQVQYRTELAPEVWRVLGPPVSTNCIRDAVPPNERRFYRICEAP